MPFRRVWTVAAVATLVLAAAAFSLGYAQVTSIARDNLTNAGFVRSYQWTPDDFGMPYRNVTIASDGMQLAGWWIPAREGSGANATTTVILVHGLGSNMSKPMRIWGPNLHAAGYSLLAFDMRNHGASPDAGRGYVTYGVDEAKDVWAAAAYVRANAPDLGVSADRLVLYGASMGAATALNAAAQRPPGVVAVIADSPFASFRFEAHIDGADQGYPRFVVDWVLGRMDALAPAPPTASRPEAFVADLGVPLLLMHCTDDENLRFANFERLQARRPEGAPSWTGSCPQGLNPEHHIDGWMDPGYNATVRAFLAAV
jgi:pimeloyl-ACP methyl ester carboxylesterase